MMDFEFQRMEMIQKQIIARGITDRRVIDAMIRIPRELFIPPHVRARAYRDGPLPIDKDQTISQPYIVALMLQALSLKGGERILEIGTGSGYAAAVAAHMAAEVYSVERHATLARCASALLQKLEISNVKIRVGDGTLGWPEQAPYGGIIVTAGGPEIPEVLLDQLLIGACLVMPVGADQRRQNLVRVEKLGEGRLAKEDLGRVQFVPLIGEKGWASQQM